MGDDGAKKWATARKLNTELDRLTRIAEQYAAQYVASSDYAADCSSEFVADKLVVWCSQDYDADLGSEHELRREAEAFARRYAYRRRRRRRKEQLQCETPNLETMASREPGPEEIVQRAALLGRLLRPLSQLSPERRFLFVRRILDEMRLVDIEAQTGRSANVLCKTVGRILDRLRRYLEGEALDAEEIEDYLSMLDAYASPER